MKITRFNFIDGTILNVEQIDLTRVKGELSEITKTISGNNYIVFLENVKYIENLEIE